MKLLITVSCSALIIFLMLASCSKDASGPEYVSPVAPLVGTWDMTEAKIISKNDPGTFFDLMDFFGIQLSVTIAVAPNGDYTVTVMMGGVTFDTVTGRFADMEDFENQMLQGDPDATLTLAGNTVTIIRDNRTFDFGNGDEPALERTVYTRR